MPALADIILFRTTGTTDPPLLHAGELAVTAAPTNVGKVWIGDGIANRLLLSANPTDLPLATRNYLPLSGAQAMTGPLTLSGPATADNHPVTLQQADGRYLQLATANTLTGAGSIVMPSGYEPTTDLQVATKGYTDKARVVISDTAPTSPRVADLWFNSLDLQTYIRYTANDWVPVINLGAGGGADPDNKYLLLTGGSLSGSLAVTGALTVASNASSDLQVVPLQQVNSIVGTLVATFLPLAGGTVTGSVRVGSSSNVGTGFAVGGWPIPSANVTPGQSFFSGAVNILSASSLTFGGAYNISPSGDSYSWSDTESKFQITRGSGADSDKLIFSAAPATAPNTLITWTRAMILSDTGDFTVTGTMHMASGYTPTNDEDVTTKKYVDGFMPATGIVTVPGPIGINRTPPADCIAGQILVNNNLVFPTTGGITWNWYAPTTYLANGTALRMSWSSNRIIFTWAGPGIAGDQIGTQTTPIQLDMQNGNILITGVITASGSGVSTLGGSLTIKPAAGNSLMSLDSLVDTESTIMVRRDGLARWSMRFYGAETGSETGCDFSLSRHADNGWLNTTPVLHASRETGMVTIPGDLEVGGDIYSSGGAFPEYLWVTDGILWVDWTLLQDTTNAFLIQVGQHRDPYNLLPTDILRFINLDKLSGLLSIGNYVLASPVAVFTLNTSTGDLTTSGTITMPASYSPATDAQVATKGYTDQLRNTSITFTYPGKPADAAMINVPLTFDITIPANFAGTRVYCTLAPTAPAPFLVDRVVGTSTIINIGTITVSTAGITFTGVSAQITLVAGDVLRVTAPGTQDVTAADIGITIAVTRA